MLRKRKTLNGEVWFQQMIERYELYDEPENEADDSDISQEITQES